MSVRIDPIQKLEHDHVHLDRIVASLRDSMAECLRGERETAELLDDLEAFVSVVQDDIFEHFEREETLLFPYLREHFPDTSKVVDSLEQSHDRICGVATRIERLITGGGDDVEANFDAIVALFARFDANYQKHSREEHGLLKDLAARVDNAHRARLYALVGRL